jgi:hypothetical protein
MDFRELRQNLEKKYNGKDIGGLRLRNANGDIDSTTLGYQIAIDYLTFIKKQVTEQKFYTVAPADFVPIAVGDGSFSQSIITNLAVNTSGDFESGIINQGEGNSRLAEAGAGISSKSVIVKNWAKAVTYTIFEVEQALRASNWDYIEALHSARKKNWDLGMQKIAFLGSKVDEEVKGLLTSSALTINTSLISKSISTMSTAEFATFVGALIQAYQANCAYTAMPDLFIIPQADFNGLATPLNTLYPTVSKLEYLKKAFSEIVPGGVEIKGLAYCTPANSDGHLSTERYVLTRRDPTSVRMDVPVDFTITQPNTVNNFQFQDAAYGQFTGVEFYRNLETLYIDLT